MMLTEAQIKEAAKIVVEIESDLSVSFNADQAAEALHYTTEWSDDRCRHLGSALKSGHGVGGFHYAKAWDVRRGFDQ